MGDDLFKSRPPFVLVKDKTRHAIGRDLDGHCFLTAIFRYPQALYIVFEDVRGWENGNLE
jgi:hypothetical protein